MADVKLPVLSINEIAKQAAERALDEITFDAGGRTYTLREFTDKIRSGEFAEVRHGRWATVEKAWMLFYKCSECGMLYNDNPNYCPRCGARMDATDTNVGHKDGGGKDAG